MKVITMITILVALFWVNSVDAVDVFDMQFGNVQPGQSKSLPLQFDAANVLGLGDAGLDRDFPFNIVAPAPFTVSPSSGTVRKQTKTTVTVTLPANTLIGFYDKVLNITVHGKNDKTLGVKVSATVVGFPLEITPADLLDLGSLSTGTIKIKHIGGSPESYTSHGLGGFDAQPFSASINPGQTQLITVSAGQIPDSGTATGTVDIKVQRTGETRTVQVKTLIVGKPDLVVSITGVKVFPRVGTETTIQVTFLVKNVGFVQSNPCQGKITLDNNKVVDLTIPEVGPGNVLFGGGAVGGTLTKVFKTTLTGTQTLKVKLDIDNKNVEPDENNNDATQDISLP